MKYIVSFDPRLTVPSGSIVEQAEALGLEARGVMLLPVDLNRFYAGPVAGHVTRLYGEAGWHYDGNTPSFGCHKIMGVNRETSNIKWALRIAPIDPQRPCSGSFKLVTDNTVGSMPSSLRPLIRVEKLPTCDRLNGATIYGESQAACAIDGFMAFAIHGVCMNVKVLASAISAVK